MRRGLKEAGVKILTLYTFSTENWKRSKKEVGALLDLLEEYLHRESNKLIENNIKLLTIGRTERFKPSLLKRIDRVNS